MSYYFAARNTHDQGPLWGDTRFLAPVLEPDTETEAALNQQYMRQFAHRPMRVQIEQRALHTRRNMIGADLYRPQQQQEQVPFDLRDGGAACASVFALSQVRTPIDYNRKLVVANVGARGEFHERLEHIDLENALARPDRSPYVAPVDPLLHQRQVRTIGAAQAYLRAQAHRLVAQQHPLGGLHLSHAQL